MDKKEKEKKKGPSLPLAFAQFIVQIIPGFTVKMFPKIQNYSNLLKGSNTNNISYWQQQYLSNCQGVNINQAGIKIKTGNLEHPIPSEISDGYIKMRDF